MSVKLAVPIAVFFDEDGVLENQAAKQAAALLGVPYSCNNPLTSPVEW